MVVHPMRLTMTAWLSSGLPRQFSVIWQNIRCSILFHLLVPGGKWHTEIFNRIWLESSCSATFHSRERLLLLPPRSYRIDRLDFTHIACTSLSSTIQSTNTHAGWFNRSNGLWSACLNWRAVLKTLLL